mmetsp:Transcript_25641/g.33473  ORF Transcript_25641/g.33473 Transcript_25641/m.33473 type:complete len:262 (-) Transcript_25641:88-873(-)
MKQYETIPNGFADEETNLTTVVDEDSTKSIMNQFHSSWKKVIGTCAVVMGCALLLVHSEKMNSQSNLKGTVDSNLPELGWLYESFGKWPWSTCKLNLDEYIIDDLSDSGSEVEIRLFIGNGKSEWNSGGHCDSCHTFNKNEDYSVLYGPNGRQFPNIPLTEADRNAMARMQNMEIRNDQDLILYTQEIDGASGNDWNEIRISNPCDQFTVPTSYVDGEINLKRKANFEGGTITWRFTVNGIKSKTWCSYHTESFNRRYCPW